MREQHSADGRSYIEHVGSLRWDVTFDGKLIGSMPTRERARLVIRAAKVEKAAHELGFYNLISKVDFDRICERLKLDPDDDALVDRLVTLGWEFNYVDDVYISPDKPEPPATRWRLLLEGLDEP